MGYYTLNYFLNNEYSNKENIIGYFDFEDQQRSGVSIFTGDYFNKNDYLSLMINNPNIFWSKSGTSNFDGNSFYNISGNLTNNFFSIVAFRNIATGKENFIFSSIGDYNNTYSGFSFGISIYGYPYIKYYDNYFGETYFSYSETINSNRMGILFFGINSSEKFFIGSYSYQDNRILEEYTNWSINWNRSNNSYIGGGPNVDSVDLFSGQIDAIGFHENTIGQDIDKLFFVSGLVYDVIESTITGTISGQTGTLFGDIISVNVCSLGFSGGAAIFSGLYTGLEYFVPSYDEFFDFNNESFSQYIYSGASGTGYSEAITQFSEIVVCSQNTTGFEFYEYDSGYQIQYEIKNISTILKNPEYLYYIYNGIKFNFGLQSGDIISIIYESPSGYFEQKSNINILNYDYSKDAYVLNNGLNKISGLYYNGQHKTATSIYYPFLNGEIIEYFVSGDFASIDGFIFSNKEFLQPAYLNNDMRSFITTDLWLESGKKIINLTGIVSGQDLNGESFENSLIFLNGQLLSSGLDYSLPNKLLLNVESGENIIFIKNLDYFNNKPYYYYNYLNENNLIYLNDHFIENSSNVWLNGIRMIKDIDYIEL
jgi:hypothetical protein